jgi:hypothetical protein
MKWAKEAEAAVSKVPFFVRKRVKRRVEEETIRRGAKEVRLEHVQTCQKWPVYRRLSYGCSSRKGQGLPLPNGGRLGRHPRLAVQLPGIYSLEETLQMVERCLDHYQRYCLKGERFGEVLERTGPVELRQILGDEKSRKGGNNRSLY